MSKNNQLEFLPLAMLRVPAFSVDRYFKLQQDPQNIPCAVALFFSESYARESLSYMAPGFYKRVIGRIESSELTASDITTLLRYANRLCFRPTPIGLCATVSTLSTGHGALPHIAESTHIRLKVGLDETVTIAMLGDPAQTENIAQTGSWIANDTIYRTGKNVRFIKLTKVNGESRAVLSAVEASQYLLSTLAFAGVPRSGQDLMNHLLETFVTDELTELDVRGFLRQLIEQQLLTPDHLYCLTDRLALNGYIAGKHSGLGEEMAAVCERLALGSTNLESAEAQVRSLLGRYDCTFPGSRVFAIDAWRDLEPDSGLPDSVMAEIDQVMRIVSGLTAQRESPFASILERWEDLYGDADLPLMHIVDEANGLYADTASRERGIVGLLPTKNRGPVPSRSPLRDALRAAYRPDMEEIDIPLSAFGSDFGADSHAKPRTGTGWFRFWRSPDDEKVHVELTGFGCWPPGRLLGRFADGSEQLRTMLRDIAQEDDGTDSVCAELVFHPRHRVANVCRRPVLARHELTIRTGASPQATQLQLSDLVVCRIGGKVRLRSISLGKWVSLRMSTAHNHELSSNLKIYKFLVDVIGQDNPSLDVTAPRVFMHDMVRVPRVKICGVTVSAASYLLHGEVLEAIRKATACTDLQGIFAAYRERHHVPEWVTFAEGDNVMLVSLESEFGRREIQDLAKKNDKVILTEYAAKGLTPALRGQDGRHTHECLVTYFKPAEPMSQSPRNRAALAVEGPRAETYGFGSKWLYFIVSVREVFQDKMLGRVWREFVDAQRAAGLIAQAFYLRYVDRQGPHLRVRVQITRSEYFPGLLAAFHAWWGGEIGKHECTEVRFQTYAPEWNRYGGVDALDSIHEIFSASSDIAVHILQQSMDLTRAALWTVDRILDAFGLDAASTRLTFARDHARGFAREYAFGEKLRQKIGALMKTLPPMAVIDRDYASDLQMAAAMARCRRSARHVLALGDQDRLSQPASAIVSSVLHMHLNRVFCDDPRAQEAVFWEVARRVYERDVAFEMAGRDRAAMGI